ncbi:cytochrome b-561 [Vigna unguiculata]|uniref:Cytochrome b-561 n=1 Tax=Vigna unguiculata TaxID=3917 RepID=A0A4D6M261_VIGUN|nr:cytochrome b-561 [Vigna unguiculata]
MVVAEHVDVLPLTFVVHLLAIPAIVLVLVWSIHFRGGLSFNSSNKSLLFNA